MSHVSSETEHETWWDQLTLLQQISRTFYTLLPAFEHHMGMSRARWGVLSQLRRQGQMSQFMLQKCLQVDGAAITRQVKLLEAEHFVQRTPDPNDNRFMLVSLTPAGEDLVESLFEQRELFEQRVSQGIRTEDIATLKRCLAQIHKNLCMLPPHGTTFNQKQEKTRKRQRRTRVRDENH